MNDLGIAISIASKAFENKKDKGGNPYILHCIRVMMRIPAENIIARIVAILHDVVEDTVITIEYLSNFFTDEVLIPLALVTHDKKTDTYEQYINKLKVNHTAVIVKLSDLKDNSDITRQKGIDDSDIERTIKYHRVYWELKEIEKAFR